MAYVEAAVIEYLQLALGAQVGVILPLRPASEVGSRHIIEAGRELATLVMVILSYTLDARRLIEGGLPGPYPWPLFTVGMLLALAAALNALRGARPSPPHPNG